MRGYISNFDDLEKWFLPLNCTGWSLYHGFQKGRLNTTNMVFKNDDDTLDLSDSFERLKEMIEMSSTGGGQFTIYVPYKSNNTGVKQYFGIGLNSHNQPQVAGLPGIYGGSLDQILAKEKKMWELEAMVNGFIEEQETRKSTAERIFEKVMDDLDTTQVVSAVIGLIGQLIPAKMPITMQGTPEEMKHHQDDGAGASFQYKTGIIMPILDMIRKHFETDDEFYNFFSIVAEKFDAQPELFKKMING